MSRYVYVGDDELAKIKGIDWCFANDYETHNWIIPEHEGFTIDQDGNLVPMCGCDGVSAKQFRYQESAKRNIMWHLENGVYDYETLKKIEAFVIKEVTA